MTDRVKRYFDLTTQILTLEYEREQLNEQLTYGERSELMALCEQMGHKMSNEAGRHQFCTS